MKIMGKLAVIFSVLFLGGMFSPSFKRGGRRGPKTNYNQAKDL